MRILFPRSGFNVVVMGAVLPLTLVAAVARARRFGRRPGQYFWPEVETNYTWFAKVEHTGKNQLFLTPALVLGRFPIHGRLGLTFGAGYQAAVTKYRAYNHAVILSLRAPF